MIRQFIRDTIADLVNAVARSELTKENARLSKTNSDLVGRNVQLATEVNNLRARLSAPCPADGMDDETLGETLVNANKSTVANVSPLRSMGRKARELFGRSAK